MTHKISRKWKRAGFTLITALAFSLIIGTVLAGVGTVSMSHLSRSKDEGDYANAVALADAGVNYELGWISRDTALQQNCTSVRVPGCIDNSPYQPSSPPIAAVTKGNFTVHVSTWNTSTNSCTNSAWAIPADMCVTSTGVVSGISRTVQIHAIGKGVFDQYAVYAYSVSVFNGTGASSKDGVVGSMGTNGPVTFNGSAGSGAIQGTLSLNGSSASSNSTGTNVQTNPDAVFFPTVSQVANSLFPGGLTWLQTHNANPSIMMLKSTDPTLATVPTVASFTLAQVNSKLTTAGFTAASRSLGSAPLGPTNDSSTLDVPTTGTRFVMAGDAAHGVPALGANTSPKGPTYFLLPGDYYLSDLSFLSKATWVMLTHLGQIRIWVDSSSTTNDDISKLNVIFSDPTASKFRLYYNKCATLKMNGQGVFSGSLYAIKNGCANGPGIDMEGGTEILGSVIANTFIIGGGSFVIFPNNGGNSGSGDFPLWFGFANNWKEIPWSASSTVFADGTSN